MVQGLVKTVMYPPVDKGQGDGNPPQDKNVNETREKLRTKWKIFLSSAILITSVFVFTGTVIYLNMNMPNNCRKGCITVHIIPYMHTSLNRMALHDCDENGIDDSFDYVVNELVNDEKRRKVLDSSGWGDHSRILKKKCIYKCYRFTITEMYSFWKWWKNQTATVKTSIRSLINEGRLEIAGGGWCIPDEALVHYRTYIDQFTWGLRRLTEIADRKISPDVSFLVDNRGHSKEIASLLRGMDFRGVMLGGISHTEQCYRRSYQKMEFLWSDGDFFGVRHEKPNLFTSLSDDRALKLNEYFMYEKPVVDLNEFFKNIICQAYGYSSNNVFIPVGVNFQFKKMKNAFSLIESLINSTKHHSKYKLNIVYSTPSSYLNSVDYNNERWWRSNGEFLPYVQGKLDFWTGYYSFRSSFKYFQRFTDRYLQILKQMIALTNTSFDITNLRESVALSQHYHIATAISGQNIVDHFYRLLRKGIADGEGATNEVFRKLMVKEGTALKLRFESCLKLNISECPVTEGRESFVLTVYNPSHRIINEYVRVPVTGNGYLVRTSDGQSLRTQLVNLPKWILSMPGRESNASKELVFRALKIPALGFRSYYVSPVTETFGTTEKNWEKNIKLVVNELTRKVTAIKRNGEVYPMSQELKYYTSWFPNNVVFRPGSRLQPITINVSIEIMNNGELVTEYVQHFGPWASQVIRIYKDEDFIEYEWAVGHVPISFFEGKDIVMSFATNIRNGYSFYIDANGRGSQLVFKRPEMENENIRETIARNYRPVNTRIGIADQDYQLHVFNDRVQGGSSPFQGQLELMLHRKFLNLAAISQREFLAKDFNERSKQIESGRQWVFVGSSKDSTLKTSIDSFASRIGWEPWYFFAEASRVSFEEWRDNHVTEFSGVRKQIPKNLRILTVEPWMENEVLLRLENIGEDGCDKLKINLQDLLSGFDVTNVTQVSLTGNNIKETFKYGFRFASNPSAGRHHTEDAKYLNNFIYPGEIKTFILAVKPLH